MNTKPYAYALIGIVVLNLIFYPLGLLPWFIFWGVITMSAIIAWKILPWMREKL